MIDRKPVERWKNSGKSDLVPLPRLKRLPLAFLGVRWWARACDRRVTASGVLLGGAFSSAAAATRRRLFSGCSWLRHARSFFLSAAVLAAVVAPSSAGVRPRAARSADGVSAAAPPFEFFLANRLRNGVTVCSDMGTACTLHAKCCWMTAVWSSTWWQFQLKEKLSFPKYPDLFSKPNRLPPKTHGKR